MYKKLHKEHLLLQRSFAAVRQSLNETLCKSQVSKEYNSSLQQRKRIKTEFDGLKRQVMMTFSINAFIDMQLIIFFIFILVFINFRANQLI
jgi:hypothetical protein